MTSNALAIMQRYWGLKLMVALVASAASLLGPSPVNDNRASIAPLAPAAAQSLTFQQAYQQGRQQFRQWEYEQALSAFKAAASLAIAANDAGLVADSLYYLGRTYHALGRYTQAFSEYEDALSRWNQLAAQITDPGLASDIQFNRAVVLTGLGRTQKALGEYEQAQSHYNEALAIHTELDSRREQAIVLDAMGSLRRSQAQHEEALKHHEQALAIIEGVYPQAENRVLNNIGVTYQGVGRTQEALRSYQQALSVPGIDVASEIVTLINVASIYVRQNNLAAAEAQYRQVLKLRDENSALSLNPVREAKLANDIGSFYVAERRYVDAIDAYNQALKLYIYQGNRPKEALVRNNIGFVLQTAGELEQAEAFHQQALTLAEAINDLPVLGEVLTDLGRLSDRRGEDRQARQYYQRAIDEVFESTLANIQSGRLKAGFADQHAFVYGRLVALLWDSGEHRLAFDYVERSRSRAFLDQIANGTIRFRDDADGQLLAREQTLRAELAQLQATLEDAAPDQTANLRAELATRQQDYLSLIARLKRQSPQAADLTTVAPEPLDALQSRLDAQTTLVEYFVLKDRVLAFVVTRNTFTTQALPITREALAEAVDSFYEYDIEGYKTPILDSTHPNSLKQLWTALIEPLQPYLTTEHLTLVPHGRLHYVPFAALSDGQQYLIDRYQLSLLPSANVLRFLKSPTLANGRPGAANPAIFGNPTLDLPFAKEEAEAIADLYGIRPLIGREATEAALRDRASQAEILHLATHGEYDVANPLFSKILFADVPDSRDGQLEVHEIYELDLRTQTQLVVLSACKTQIGEASDGDEIIGLSRAFLYAGTPNVIATLWPIDDLATAELMRQFHQFLQQGMPYTEALQRSQQAMKEYHPHPYFWAAFGLTGMGR